MNSTDFKKILATAAVVALAATPVAQVAATSGDSSYAPSTSGNSSQPTYSSSESGNSSYWSGNSGSVSGNSSGSSSSVSGNSVSAPSNSDDSKPAPSYVDPYQQEINAYTEHAKKVEEAGKKPENKTVAGKKSDVDGLYYASKVDGVAFTSEDGKSAAKVVVFDTNFAQSSNAAASIEAQAAENGSEVGPAIDVYFSKADINSAKTVSIGIPKSFQKDGATYSVIAVVPGGTTYTLADTDGDPATVTVSTGDISASQAVFALARQ